MTTSHKSPAPAASDTPLVLPRTLGREPVERWFLLALLASQAVMLVAVCAMNALAGRPWSQGNSMFAALMASSALGLALVFCVPRMLHRVVLEPERLSVRTWTGTSRLSYAQIRVVRVRFQRYQSRRQRGHTMSLVLEGSLSMSRTWTSTWISSRTASACSWLACSGSTLQARPSMN